MFYCYNIKSLRWNELQMFYINFSINLSFILWRIQNKSNFQFERLKPIAQAKFKEHTILQYKHFSLNFIFFVNRLLLYNIIVGRYQIAPGAFRMDTPHWAFNLSKQSSSKYSIPYACTHEYNIIREHLCVYILTAIANYIC